MSHTSGPWRRRTFKADAGEVLDANGNWVARVHRRNNDEDEGAECFANTCLMAAAPDLLRVANEYRAEHDANLAREGMTPPCLCGFCIDAASVIRRAKGEA